MSDANPENSDQLMFEGYKVEREVAGRGSDQPPGVVLKRQRYHEEAGFWLDHDHEWFGDADSEEAP